jgi:S-adenosylmethionine:tRNA ribosyltransferase-isomerase
MKLSDFQYDLPVELIAQEPLKNRTSSRLLILDGKSGAIQDQFFHHIVDLIQPEDLLVFNDTQVIPARLFGQKETGGKIEVLVERLLEGQRFLAHVRASKAPKSGTVLLIEQQFEVKVLGRKGALFELECCSDQPLLSLLEQYGHIPLPPYIERSDRTDDRERYQTIFAKKPGAVAAPTAGLHFDDVLLQTLRDKGVRMANVTLHVGAGTFQPVKVDDVSKHIMHAEYVEVSEATCQAVAACKQRGGRVVAVGTTTVRSLESAVTEQGLQPYTGETRLFITAGYPFAVVDRMITNFHLPSSTLLMLVAAFSGYDAIFSAYQHAVAQQYRFFSYGDAMFLTPQCLSTPINHVS